MALKLPKLDRSFPLVDKDGLPTVQFQMWWSQLVTSIETSVNNIQAALDAAAAAQASAVVAQAAAESAQTAVDNLETGVIVIDERTTNARQFWNIP